MSTLTLERRHTGDALITLASRALIAGALLQIILGIPLASIQAQEPPPAIIPALNILSHLLLLAGVAGLARSGAAGRSLLGIAGLAVSLLGLTVLVVAEVSWLAEMGATDALYGIATLAMMLGLILVGIAVMRTKRWISWHRFTPLACGLFISLVLVPSFALPGLAMNYAIGLWGLCWLLLGVALRSEATRES